MDAEELLSRFRLRDPDPALRERVLGGVSPAKPVIWHRRWLQLAAAALVALGIGWGALQLFQRGQDRNPVNEKTIAAVEILRGEGRVIPVGADTQFQLVDAARGQLRLERGAIYVELKAGAGLQAEVVTPAGKATAKGTRFCAHVAEPSEGSSHPFLAVAILDGAVAVSNDHGEAVADAGELVLARRSSAPEKLADSSTLHGQQSCCPFVSTLGLIYRPDVQAELKLTEAQQQQFGTPGAAELQDICRFFRGLQALPHRECVKRAEEFRHAQQRKLQELLSPEQLDRLRQIGVHQEGWFSLARPEVAAAIGMNEDQRQQVRDVLHDFSQAHQALGTENVKDPRFAALRRQTLDRLAALLTKEQKARWHDHAGQPFPARQRL